MPFSECAESAFLQNHGPRAIIRTALYSARHTEYLSVLAGENPITLFKQGSDCINTK